MDAGVPLDTTRVHFRAAISRGTMGTVIKGAGERIGGIRDRLFQDVEKWTSRGRGEQGHDEGGKVELSHSPSG